MTQLCLNEHAFKNYSNGGLDAWDPSIYLNVWICYWNGLLGYAYFPCLLKTENEFLDGVSMNVDVIGSELDDDGTFYFRTNTYWNEYFCRGWIC